jgi:hypothetical protein
MSDVHNVTSTEMTREPELTEEEVEAFRRDQVVLDPERDPERVGPEQYPAMWNASAGFLYRAVMRAEFPDPSEYVSIPLPQTAPAELLLAVTEWNIMWEAAQYRRRIFDHKDLPAKLRRIADRGDINVVFVPRTKSRYFEYASLAHLLPRSTMERYGLPLLQNGQWPFFVNTVQVDRYLPADFGARLARAWAWAIWRHLMPASPIRGFSASDPIRVLAQNLDFWIPHTDEVIQQVLRGLPTVDKGIDEGPVPLKDGSFIEGTIVANPRMGRDIWRGEESAAETVQWVVEEADADGRLRAVLDAVRSNRVEDDFSEHWTYAREDFERKLYKKRSKVQVKFVELTDSTLVQGADTEVVDHMMYGEFLTLLDERERQIVVLLHSGVTKLTEVGHILGYANHSAVSKRLAAIRTKAERFFDQN